MSQVEKDIKREFEKLAGLVGPVTVYPATVVSVNSDDMTVEAEFSTGLVLDDVRLRSVISAGNKCVLIPSEGSNILVSRIENSDEFFVVAVGAVSEVRTEIDGLTVSISEKLEVKKGDDSLSKVLSDLIAEINKIVVLYGTSPNVAALTLIDERQKLFLL